MSKQLNKRAASRTEAMLSNGDYWISDPVSIRSAAVPYGKILLEADERIGELACEWISESVKGDSPIEKILHSAITVGSAFGQQDFELVPMSLFNPEAFENIKERQSYGAGVFRKSPLLLFPQARLLDWPVDYFLAAYRPGDGGGWETLVIECDGHDFHERTKEQAAKDRGRDRRLQEAGHKVFRFTGSEIWKDPVGCAQQVFDWANLICGF